MPSSRRGRRQQAYQPLNLERLNGIPRSVTRYGNDYSVQRITGNAKSYVCPGCQHEVAPFTAHVVVYATAASFGVELGVAARRHWHTRCWQSGSLAR